MVIESAYETRIKDLWFIDETMLSPELQSKQEREGKVQYLRDQTKNDVESQDES